MGEGGGTHGAPLRRPNPNQRLGGTSGQRPNADSQRQPDKEPTTPESCGRTDRLEMRQPCHLQEGDMGEKPKKRSVWHGILFEEPNKVLERPRRDTNRGSEAVH